MSKDVTLTCRLRPKPESLRIDYEIVNDTGRGVYAFVLPTSSTMEPFHHQTYAALSSNRKVLYLVVDRSPTPDARTLRGRRKAIPLATFLEPGARHSDRFMAYYPVREWHAYASSQDGQYGSAVPVGHAVLSIAYAFEDSIVRAEKARVPGYHEVETVTTQKLIQTLRLTEPIPVQPRLDSKIRMTF